MDTQNQKPKSAASDGARLTRDNWLDEAFQAVVVGGFENVKVLALAEKLKKAGTKFVIEPHIRFKGQVGEQATMFFYDPSGNAVYETSNRSKGWDGSVSGGNQATIGQNYQWRVLIINDLTKEEKYFNGTLNIIP